MRILNVNYKDEIDWTEAEALKILQRANPNKSEKELKALIKASKLVKNGLQTTTSKSKNRKGKHSTDNRDANNI